MKHGSALGHDTTLAERLGEHRVDALAERHGEHRVGALAERHGEHRVGAAAALFRDTDGERVGSLDLPDTTPMVTVEIPAPEGAPTALVALLLPFLIALII